MTSSNYKKSSESFLRKRKIRYFLLKFYKICQILFLVLLIAFIIWLLQFGGSAKVSEAYDNIVDEYSRDAGVYLQDVEISGNNVLEYDFLYKYIWQNIDETKPFIHLAVTDIQKSLTKIGWIKYASVKKKLPDKLIINITERQPVAIWILGDKKLLIDDEGEIITSKYDISYSYLPEVKNLEKPKRINEFFEILAKTPEFLVNIKTITLIGNRRWDILTNEGITIKLPEKYAKITWEKFQELNRIKNLLEKDLKYIDLRIEDQVIVGLADGEQIFTD